MGETPLHWAVQMSQLEVVELLTRYSADVDQQNNYGETPLDLQSSPQVKAVLTSTAAALARRTRLHAR